MGRYMVNNFCVFKCLNVSTTTTVFNSRRCFKDVSIKPSYYNLRNLTPFLFSSLDNKIHKRRDGSIVKI